MAIRAVTEARGGLWSRARALRSRARPGGGMVFRRGLIELIFRHEWSMLSYVPAYWVQVTWLQAKNGLLSARKLREPTTRT